jgi:hypothetical protein
MTQINYHTMSSKVLHITIDSIPHIINLNHVFKVALKENYIHFYYTVGTGNLGAFFAGSGFIQSGVQIDKIHTNSKETAKEMFEKIAKLM